MTREYYFLILTSIGIVAVQVKTKVVMRGTCAGLISYFLTHHVSDTMELLQLTNKPLSS